MCDFTACVAADLTAADIDALSEHPEVQAMDIDEPVPGTVNGNERHEAYQAQLFWDKTFTCSGPVRSYDGDRRCKQNVHVAVADNQEFLTTHVAFRANSGSGSHFGRGAADR